MNTKADEYVIVYDPNGNPVRVKRSAVTGQGQEAHAEEAGLGAGAKAAIVLGGSAATAGTAYYFRDELGQGYDAAKDAVMDGVEAYKKDGFKAAIKEMYDSIRGKDDVAPAPAASGSAPDASVTPATEPAGGEPKYVTLNPADSKIEDLYLKPVDFEALKNAPPAYKPTYVTLNPDDSKIEDLYLKPVDIDKLRAEADRKPEPNIDPSSVALSDVPATPTPIPGTAPSGPSAEDIAAYERASKENADASSKALASSDPSSMAGTDVPASPTVPPAEEIASLSVTPVTPAAPPIEMLTPLPDPERVPLGVIPEAPPVVIASGHETLFAPQPFGAAAEVPGGGHEHPLHRVKIGDEVPAAPLDKYAGLDPQTRSVVESLDRTGMEAYVADHRAEELQIGKYAPGHDVPDIRNGADLKADMLASQAPAMTIEGMEAKLGASGMEELAKMGLKGMTLPDPAPVNDGSMFKIPDMSLNLSNAVDVKENSAPIGLDARIESPGLTLGG